MKILEELRQEQVQQRQGETSMHGAPPPAAPATEAVQRAIELMFAQLCTFAEGLNQLDAKVPVSYDIEGMGTLADLRQCDYTVEERSCAQPSFDFRARCAGSHPLSCVVSTRAERDALQEELRELGLIHRADDLSTWRYAVTVKPEVQVCLTFLPSASGRSIRVEVNNLSRLGQELFSIQPDQVSEDLLNELGKMVLRRENRFARLSGNAVPEEVRRQLQARVQARRSRQAKLAAEVQQERHDAGTRRRTGGDGDSNRPHLRQAPIMVSERAVDEGLVIWDAPDTGPDDGDDAVTELAPAPIRNRADATQETPRYAWMITKDRRCSDTSSTIAKRGPAGAQKLFPIPSILNKGESFRLKTRDGEVRYLGSVIGDYQGVEPLVDFGLRHGCYVIEYQRNGEWVRVRPTD